MSAAALLVTAGAFAIRPEPPPPEATTETVVASHDLAAGGVLKASDVHLARFPASLRPANALGSAAAVSGRLLTGAAAAGEPITDARLVSVIPGSGDLHRSLVPIRLADAGVAELLRPGSRVDVVAAGESGAEQQVLASMAVVVTVSPPDPETRHSPAAPARGPLVLISLPPEAATQVASVSLDRRLAVTLR